MPYIPSYSLIFTLCLLQLKHFTQRQIQTPNHIETKHLKLYSNPPNAKPPQHFTTPLQYLYSSPPLLVYGITEYYLAAFYSSENVDSTLITISTDSFTLKVQSFGSTNNLWLSISYIAIQKATYFASEYININLNPNKKHNNTHQNYPVNTSINFNSANYICLPMLTAFAWKNQGSFGFSLNASVISANIYEYTISQAINFTMKSINFYILFYEKQTLIQNNYYITNQEIIFSSNSLPDNYSFNIGMYNQTIFLLVINGFYGDSQLTNRQLSWEITDLANNIADLTIQKSHFHQVYYSYLQIGIISTTSKYTYNFLMQIGITSGTLILFLILVIIYKRCQQKKRRKFQIQSQSLQNLRSFPTLSFN